ncbi:DUF3006 domain-containing protein [Neobacillus sp. YIM B06451]|uniref:DUF3006 domain-containing protein n=1 Tax=Neobacillus sp. YIM B06451 TaxID=3070994 RepID=UPI002931A875|nr:DUF3006 domain-containing protein [Neobacillus sp. YIM B06451]
MRGIIDRFEGELVVIEVDGDMRDFPKEIFPTEAEPGDVVEIVDGKVTILNAETDKLKKEIEDLMREIWED